MSTNRPLSVLLFSGLALTLSSVGCGGGNEDYVVVSRPIEQLSEGQRRPPEAPEATVLQAKDCLRRHVASLSEKSYALQYRVGMDDQGKILQVDLQDSTLENAEVEACFGKVIAAMQVPKEALELRSSRPFSGGERMNRERRGPIGSESKPGIVWLGPIIVEMVGIEVIIQVGLGVIAAVATIVDTTDKEPRDECQEHKSNCLASALQSRPGSLRGSSMCLWCEEQCKKNGGVWPTKVTGVGPTPRWCDYWRK